MLFKMFLQKFKKRKLREKKITQASYQVPCEKFLMFFLFPTMTTLDTSQAQRHHLAGG